jgi:uncharacterized protein (TIGR00369 family)
MNLEKYSEETPYWNHMGMDLLELSEDHVKVKLNLEEEHSSISHKIVAHGGVISSLIDTAGGILATSINNSPTPTLDLRVDYLNPATSNLLAYAEILKEGSSTIVITCEVYDIEETHVASGRVVYKIIFEDTENTWSINL